MNRREFAKSAALGALAAGAVRAAPERVNPGVWRLRFGTPEKLTPIAVRNKPAKDLPGAPPPEPKVLRAITGRKTSRGYILTIPLEPNELVYGLGLQMKSFLQRGSKKTLRVNADPIADSGDTHAPVPFYVTNQGYGILIDTARYATIYPGNKTKKGRSERKQDQRQGATEGLLPAAYGRYRINEASEVIVELRDVPGADIYVFGGPSMREAVQRYVMFSGGGALPARWGLGFWYRAYGQFDQKEVLAAAQDLRRADIPCDVLGLEPGWQSHAYSCSFVWSEKFPDPTNMIAELKEQNMEVNLWEHAFTHPSSPIYKELLPHSGQYEVFGGIVPDFLTPEARRIFTGIQEKEHVARGVTGYKLDECDNSDYTRNWSFPELDSFPSGADGEQMHCFLGIKYQDTINSIFEKRNQRTFSLVRSSHALAAPYPYVLYSDLYDHKDFIRALVNSGFSGLLWCPEVRDAASGEDLIRRLETVVLSPLAMVNAWYIKNPPWKQINREKNNRAEFTPGWQDLEKRCREIIRLRMRFVPYLYSAYVRYMREGITPFRALVMDYPEDPAVWTIDDQYLMGESLMIAPLVAGQKDRSIYVPKGVWYDFWNNGRVAGGERIHFEGEGIPILVKAGTVLPLANPTLHTGDPASFRLTANVYGDGSRPCELYEDDGRTLEAQRGAMRTVRLTWDSARRTGNLARSGIASGPEYSVEKWITIG